MSELSLTKNTLEPDKWVDNYSDYLFNYAIVRMNNHDLGKDLVQETFLAGLKSAKKNRIGRIAQSDRRMYGLFAK